MNFFWNQFCEYKMRIQFRMDISAASAIVNLSGGGDTS